MEIVWTDLAYETLKNVISYINENHGLRVALRVRTLLYQRISLLNATPLLGKSIQTVNNGDVRVIIVAKKSRVFYYLRSGKIYIIMIWDVRRNPESLEINLSRFFRDHQR